MTWDITSITPQGLLSNNTGWCRENIKQNRKKYFRVFQVEGHAIRILKEIYSLRDKCQFIIQICMHGYSEMFYFISSIITNIIMYVNVPLSGQLGSQFTDKYLQ